MRTSRNIDGPYADRADLERRLAALTELKRSRAERRSAKGQPAEARRMAPVSRDGPLLCTHQQEGLWFLHQMDPFSAGYDLPFAVRLRGDLDVEALRRALHALVVRHEALRTRFVAEGGLPRQVVDPPPAELSMPVVDMAGDDIDRWVVDEIARPIDLAAGPLFRVCLGRVAPGDHVLLMVVHHIAADGWSVGILAAELSHLYVAETNGVPATLPPLRVQPADHAAWQRGWLDGAELDRQVGYWRAALTGMASLNIPTDRPRPAVPGGAGATAVRRLSTDLSDAARTYSRANRASLLAVLHAALSTVLSRYTEHDDIAIGSVFSGRTRAELETLVSFIANPVVLRTDLGGDPSFADLVRRCHDTVTAAAARQDVPFSLVVDALQPQRVGGRNPLVPIGLSLLPEAGVGGDLTLGDVAVEPLEAATAYARFDIAIEVIDTRGGALEVLVEYSTELFDADRIDRLLDHFTTALAGGLADPDRTIADIDILPTAERDLILHTWNPPPSPRTPGLLHQVLAGHDPDRIAIRFAGTDLTYGHLEKRSNQLAHALRRHGIGPGHIVGLLLDRGTHLPTAQLAVMKAGAAWLPLDPQHPAARLALQTIDAAATLVLTTTDLTDLTPAGTPHWTLDTLDLPGPDSPPDVHVRPDDPAYLLYTSGSTGTPKGVLVHHRGVHSYCRTAVEVFRLTPADRVAQVSNPAFDASIFDCYVTFLAGATLVGATREIVADPAAFAAFIRAEEITLSYIPPAVLALLDPDELADTALRGIFASGEALPPEQASRWSRPGLELHNSFGTTETTVVVTDYLCTAEPLTGPTPIGTALTNHSAYALDKRLRPTPIGVPGQLFVAGTGVTYGYHGRPGLTAERFLADPYGELPGQRMYATGDLVRWRADGVLEYLGRRDRQVQIRGQRVELGEIEHTLTRHPQVRQCAVLLRDRVHLVAYLAGEPDLDQLREYLAHRLPTYMIPTTLIPLPELPLTPNGKVDTTRLPDPEEPAKKYVAPRTGTERWLADTWRDLIGVDRVGAGDDFFDLGGNSLHITQLVARVRDEFSLDLTPRELFAGPVLEQVAARLNEAGPAAVEAPIVPVPRAGPLVCTYQQEGLWFIQQLDPSSAMYHIPFAVRLRGDVDLPAMERALSTLVVRHEALRTRFLAADGVPRQVVDPPQAVLPLPVIAVAGDVQPWLAAEIARPLDLAAGSVFRVAMARTSPDEHVLLMVVHHIVADGWSAGILADELTQLYAAETGVAGAGLPVLDVQPADHAAWQRARLDSAELDRQLGYWRERLASLPTVDFPTDRPRPAQPTGAGTTVSRRLPYETAVAAQALARERRLSFLAVLQTALLIVLHRYTGQDDLPIGSVFSGRTRAEMEPMVGFFANTVVLRTDAGGDPSFGDLVRRCHDTVLEVTAHQDLPFSVLVDALQPERVAGRNPLFQISLTLQPARGAGGGKTLRLGALTVEPIDIVGEYSRFDLGIDVTEAAEGEVYVSVEYSTELFDADRIERLVDHYTAALAGGLADPDGVATHEIELMPAQERHRVLHGWAPPPDPAGTVAAEAAPSGGG